MTTTTIRLEDAMKARIATAAGLAGKTAHAFILEAISQTVEQVELDREFYGLAEQRWAKIKASGKTVSWDATRAYLVAKSRGDSPQKPKARKITR
jgi:predicted transcriptional regulator